MPAGFGIDWDEITKRKQKRINESCEQENKKRIGRACQEGGKVLAEVPKKALRKLEKPRRGPLTVIEIMVTRSTVSPAFPTCTDG